MKSYVLGWVFSRHEQITTRAKNTLVDTKLPRGHVLANCEAIARMGLNDASKAMKWSSTFTQQYGISYTRSEEHTSELQSHSDLVCRLLLEKKKKNIQITIIKHIT